MALRFAVQADTEQECAAGLELLHSLGLVTRMEPRLLTDDRWMARAVPRMSEAPTVEGAGRGPGVSG
jgi:hypothetical protein